MKRVYVQFQLKINCLESSRSFILFSFFTLIQASRITRKYENTAQVLILTQYLTRWCRIVIIWSVIIHIFHITTCVICSNTSLKIIYLKVFQIQYGEFHKYYTRLYKHPIANLFKWIHKSQRRWVVNFIEYCNQWTIFSYLKLTNLKFKKNYSSDLFEHMYWLASVICVTLKQDVVYVIKVKRMTNNVYICYNRYHRINL